MKFNRGVSARALVLKELKMPIYTIQRDIFNKVDTKRVRHAQLRSTAAAKLLRNTRKRADDALRVQLEAREGLTYAGGMF